MKSFLLFFSFIVSLAVNAQQNKVNALPAGIYKIQPGAAAKFSAGDIEILDDTRYQLKNESVVGEYKFSITAQRVLFVSGTLKGAFARTILSNGAPAILLPLKENEALGFRFADADLVASYQRK